jgi:hypothetical protein
MASLNLIDNTFYRYALALQLFFYLSALAGYVLERTGLRVKLFAIPLYFLVVNFASVIAFYRTLTGKNAVVWQTVRR